MLTAASEQDQYPVSGRCGTIQPQDAIDKWRTVVTDVCIVGMDQAPVKENWGSSLRDLATGTALRAVENANATRVDALFVGNMLAGQMSEQAQRDAGVTPEFVRVSVGLEHIDDIIADFDQALKNAVKK